MASVIAYIPTGYSPEKKKAYIHAIDVALSEGLKLAPQYHSIVLRELDPSEQCDVAAHGRQIWVYTAPGKGIEHKNEMVKAFDREVRKILDPDEANMIVVMVKEHPHENVAVDGVLRCYDEEMKAYLESINGK